MRRVLWLLVACLAAASCGGDEGSVFSTGPTAASSTSEPADELVDDGSGIPLSEVLPPEGGTIISTASWGEVYDRRVMIVLADGADPEAADEVAAAVGGTVVGRIEELLVFEVEVAASGEAALAETVEALAGNPLVAQAAPLGVAYLARDAAEMPCGPLEAPQFQQGDWGDQYSLIGVEDAWRLVRAAGLPLAKPSIGVVDGFGSSTGFHGAWVQQTLAGTDGAVNPPGVFDALMGEGAATVNAIDVFGTSNRTSTTAFLSAMNTLADNGATVINVSIQTRSATQAEKAAVRATLRHLATYHPQTLVVTVAGNFGIEVAANSLGGESHPSLVTVGGLNHQGDRWLETWTDAAGVQQTSGSNYVGPQGGEVTLSAIAQDVFTGMNDAGDPAVQSGTSFAAPQVAAAAAVLQALDPTLSAAEVKQILVDSAATEIANPDINQRITAVDPALGGRVLRIDNAVYKLMSERLGVTAPRDQLIAKGTLNVRARPADDDPLTYIIRATAPGGGDSAVVQIVANTNSAGALLPNQPSMTTDDDVARWRWMFSGYGETAQVTLTRTDTSACARLTLTATEPTFLYAGRYEGSVAYAQYQVTGEVFYVPFTLVVDEAGNVTGEGEAEDTLQGDDDTVTLHFTVRFEGTADEAGNLVLTAHLVYSAVSTSGEEGSEEGDFSFTWAIDENGNLSGIAVWQEGQEWPVTGQAVSGGPAGLP